MKSYSKVTYVLHIALIEIRAAESLKKAQVFADVMHNVPMMLSNERLEPEIISEIMTKAERQGVDQYFSKLFEMANRNQRIGRSRVHQSLPAKPVRAAIPEVSALSGFASFSAQVGHFDFADRATFLLGCNTKTRRKPGLC